MSFDDFRRNVLTVDVALHLAAGTAFAAFVLINNPLTTAMTFAAWGWLREGAQHRYEGPWIGWITPSRLAEALSWGVGAGAYHLALVLA